MRKLSLPVLGMFVLIIFNDRCISAVNMVYKIYRSNRISWYEAREECVQKASVLATVSDSKFLTQVELVDSGAIPGLFWIGYHRYNKSAEWMWQTDIQPKWENWASDEGSTEGDCVVVSTSDSYQWRKKDCSESYGYMCQEARVEPKKQMSQYTLFNEDLTWNEAKQKCAEMGQILATVYEQSVLFELNYKLLVKIRAFWIGYRRVGDLTKWQWQNINQKSEWENWRNSNDIGKGNCASVLNGINTKYEWKTEDCNRRLPFLCEKVTRESCTFQTKKGFKLLRIGKKVLTHSSVGDCSVACLRETAFHCLSFDYSPGYSECQLNDNNQRIAGMDKLLYAPDWTYGHKICSLESSCNFIVSYDVTRFGERREERETTAVEECLKACSDEVSFYCMSFNFYTVSKSCYLSGITEERTEPNTVTVAPGWIYGKRECVYGDAMYTEATKPTIGIPVLTSSVPQNNSITASTTKFDDGSTDISHGTFSVRDIKSTKVTFKTTASKEWEDYDSSEDISETRLQRIVSSEISSDKSEEVMSTRTVETKTVKQETISTVPNDIVPHTIFPKSEEMSVTEPLFTSQTVSETTGGLIHGKTTSIPFDASKQSAESQWEITTSPLTSTEISDSFSNISQKTTLIVNSVASPDIFLTTTGGIIHSKTISIPADTSNESAESQWEITTSSLASTEIGDSFSYISKQKTLILNPVASSETVRSTTGGIMYSKTISIRADTLKQSVESQWEITTASPASTEIGESFPNISQQKTLMLNPVASSSEIALSTTDAGIDLIDRSSGQPETSFASTSAAVEILNSIHTAELSSASNIFETTNGLSTNISDYPTSSYVSDIFHSSSTKFYVQNTFDWSTIASQESSSTVQLADHDTETMTELNLVSSGLMSAVLSASPIDINSSYTTTFKNTPTRDIFFSKLNESTFFNDSNSIKPTEMMESSSVNSSEVENWSTQCGCTATVTVSILVSASAEAPISSVESSSCWFVLPEEPSSDTIFPSATEPLSEKIEKLQALTRKAKQRKLHLRRISVPNRLPHSKYMGYTSMAFIFSTLGLILISDLSTLPRDIKRLKRRLGIKSKKKKPKRKKRTIEDGINNLEFNARGSMNNGVVAVHRAADEESEQFLQQLNEKIRDLKNDATPRQMRRRMRRGFVNDECAISSSGHLTPSDAISQLGDDMFEPPKSSDPPTPLSNGVAVRHDADSNGTTLSTIEDDPVVLEGKQDTPSNVLEHQEKTSPLATDDIESYEAGDQLVGKYVVNNDSIMFPDSKSNGPSHKSGGGIPHMGSSTVSVYNTRKPTDIVPPNEGEVKDMPVVFIHEVAIDVGSGDQIIGGYTVNHPS